MAWLFDHVWQSALYVALTWLLAQLLRGESARIHVWLWRLAAMKFALPFALLHAFGGWLGFPVRHSALPPPSVLVEALDAARPWFAPVSAAVEPSIHVWVVSVALAGSCATLIWFEGRRARRRSSRQSRTHADFGVAPGFWKSALLASVAATLLAAPILAGAVADRLWRQQVLHRDTQALGAARIEVVEVPRLFGERHEVIARHDGVLIRRVNLKDLVSMVYGIGEFEVYGGTLPWLESPYYDVRVTGAVHSPAAFDPYALRQPVTNYLNAEYGISIRVNGDCLDPCLDHESFHIERLPWKLLDTLRGRAAATRRQ